MSNNGLSLNFTWFNYDSNPWAQDPSCTLYDVVKGLERPRPGLFFGPSARTKMRRELEGCVPIGVIYIVDR